MRFANKNETECRKKLLLGELGEYFDPVNCNKSCDFCNSRVIIAEAEVSDIMNSALELLRGNKGKTLLQTIDYLKGKGFKNEYKTPLYGRFQSEDSRLIYLVLLKMIDEGLLSERTMTIKRILISLLLHRY